MSSLVIYYDYYTLPRSINSENTEFGFFWSTVNNQQLERWDK